MDFSGVKVFLDGVQLLRSHEPTLNISYKVDGKLYSTHVTKEELAEMVGRERADEVFAKFHRERPRLCEKCGGEMKLQMFTKGNPLECCKCGFCVF